MDVAEMTSILILISFLSIAVIQDVRSLKVSNRLILTGMCVAVILRILRDGVSGIVWILPGIFIPVIVLYLFYLAGILGAADIKLFSLIGCYLKLNELMYCIVVAFIVGAALALLKMLITKRFISRIYAGISYVCELAKGNIQPYQWVDDENVVHFSIAILIGVIFVEIYSNIM